MSAKTVTDPGVLRRYRQCVKKVSDLPIYRRIVRIAHRATRRKARQELRVT